MGCLFNCAKKACACHGRARARTLVSDKHTPKCQSAFQAEKIVDFYLYVNVFPMLTLYFGKGSGDNAKPLFIVIVKSRIILVAYQPLSWKGFRKKRKRFSILTTITPSLSLALGKRKAFYGTKRKLFILILQLFGTFIKRKCPFCLFAMRISAKAF